MSNNDRRHQKARFDTIVKFHKGFRFRSYIEVLGPDSSLLPNDDLCHCQMDKRGTNWLVEFAKSGRPSITDRSLKTLPQIEFVCSDIEPVVGALVEVEASAEGDGPAVVQVDSAIVEGGAGLDF